MDKARGFSACTEEGMGMYRKHIVHWILQYSSDHGIKCIWCSGVVIILIDMYVLSRDIDSFSTYPQILVKVSQTSLS